MNSVTFITHHCPRACAYCSIRHPKGVGSELSVAQWIEAFAILKKMGVTFNLIFGGEPWILGEKLLRIMQHNEVPYGLHTVCFEPLFRLFGRRWDRYFYTIDNLLCEIDYSLSYLQGKDGKRLDHSERKALDAWKALSWIRKHYPATNIYATIIMHRRNLDHIPETSWMLSDLGIPHDISFLNWDMDGRYDRLPNAATMSDWMIPQDADNQCHVRKILDMIIEKPRMLQNSDMLRLPTTTLLGMGWHCRGDPYGGPTIDSDGTLRLCSLRRGARTPQFSIFDLPCAWDEWQEAVAADAAECPGCSWSHPWTYHYWKNSMNNMAYIFEADFEKPGEVM